MMAARRARARTRPSAVGHGGRVRSRGLGKYSRSSNSAEKLIHFSGRGSLKRRTRRSASRAGGGRPRKALCESINNRRGAARNAYFCHTSLARELMHTLLAFARMHVRSLCNYSRINHTRSLCPTLQRVSHYLFFHLASERCPALRIEWRILVKCALLRSDREIDGNCGRLGVPSDGTTDGNSYVSSDLCFLCW